MKIQKVVTKSLISEFLKFLNFVNLKSSYFAISPEQLH